MLPSAIERPMIIVDSAAGRPILNVSAMMRPDGLKSRGFMDRCVFLDRKWIT